MELGDRHVGPFRHRLTVAPVQEDIGAAGAPPGLDVAPPVADHVARFEVEAENGKEALEQFRKHTPEVVLLDWNMPVMDGLEFIKALRALDASAGKQPIVIFCTTENDIGKIQAAIAAGADEYIMKPFDLEIIRAKFMQVGLL